MSKWANEKGIETMKQNNSKKLIFLNKKINNKQKFIRR